MRGELVDGLGSHSPWPFSQGAVGDLAPAVVEDQGVAPRYFPTKDDLIVAYLERPAQWERDAIAGARAAAGNASEVFRIITAAIGAASRSPGFRGCPFINAAAEYADPEHPVRHVVDAHLRWFKGFTQEFLDEIGVPGFDRVADELMMLRDGAMVSGYLSDPRAVADAVYAAGRAVIEFSRAR